MYEVNVPLLRKTLEHITEHPEEWDQTSWARQILDEGAPTKAVRVGDAVIDVAAVSGSCRTACCLAGTAVQFAGHEIDWDNASPNCACDECGGGFTADYVKDGRLIEEVASDELGLTYEQAVQLFSAENTLRELWEMASSFTGDEIEVPEGKLPGDSTGTYEF